MKNIKFEVGDLKKGRNYLRYVFGVFNPKKQKHKERGKKKGSNTVVEELRKLYLLLPKQQ